MSERLASEICEGPLGSGIRLSAPSKTWQPIETAPKTSRAKLVWCPVWRNTYIVSWITPLGEDAQPRPDDGFWAHFGGGSNPLNEKPTHWQPLPEPPEEQP